MVGTLSVNPIKMTTTRLLLTAWDFDWSVIVGCVLILMVYFFKPRANRWQRMCFVCGICILFLSLQSPLDALSDTYLFSAHMAQHLFLILLVPPLLLLGIAESDVRSWLKIVWIARIERVLGNPYVAWFIGVATMTVWHVPVLYNFALSHESAPHFSTPQFSCYCDHFLVAGSPPAAGAASAYRSGGSVFVCRSRGEFYSRHHFDLHASRSLSSVPAS